jgi:CRP-like cAMP-binding protein
MPQADLDLIGGTLEPIDLPFDANLSAPGMPVESIVFPASGLVSIVTELPDGVRVEVGLVGRESLVGLTALLGEPHAPFRAIVQIPGRGHRASVAALQLLADNSRPVRDLVRRHALVALLHASITAACNASHLLEHRAARWLLEVQDRVGPGFPITQEYLAMMLGARRPPVNAVMKRLKAAGLIRHARGRIAITDRAGLQALACPCYEAERAAFARLLPRGDVG